MEMLFKKHDEVSAAQGISFQLLQLTRTLEVLEISQKSSGFVKCSACLSHAFSRGGNGRPTASVPNQKATDSSRRECFEKNMPQRSTRYRFYLFITVIFTSEKDQLC